MHIITGLVMAHLFKRNKDKQAADPSPAMEPMAPLLRLHSPVRTVHLLPGRVRFRVPCLCGDDQAGEHLRATLGRVASVQHLDVDPVTGSVLIRYDAEAINAALLVAAIIKILNLEGELDKVPASRMQREVRHVSKALNRALYDQTHGLLDMKTAVFLSLAALGTAKLWQQRSLALPAGFTLLWWAGNGLLGRRGGGE
jgi:hypothetical protein